MGINVTLSAQRGEVQQQLINHCGQRLSERPRNAILRKRKSLVWCNKCYRLFVLRKHALQASHWRWKLWGVVPRSAETSTLQDYVWLARSHTHQTSASSHASQSSQPSLVWILVCSPVTYKLHLHSRSLMNCMLCTYAAFNWPSSHRL